jgi:hypothetical protein
MSRRAAAWLALACATPDVASAARPMVADDARLADAGACQLESWVRRNEESTEYWAMPACNPWGNLELGVGAARTRAQGSSRFTDVLVQAKTLLRPLTDDGWGVGATFGTTRHPAREHDSGWPGDVFLNVPLSRAVLRETWIVHVNAGAVRERSSGRTLGTWALGNELRVNEDLFVTAEAFRNDFGRPLYQVGFRHWLVRDRVEIDGSAGMRGAAAANEHWFTLGVHLQFAPFGR